MQTLNRQEFRYDYKNKKGYEVEIEDRSSRDITPLRYVITQNSFTI